MTAKNDIERLLRELDNLPYRQDVPLQKFLIDLRQSLQRIFGESCQYLNYLDNIRFKPVSFFSSEEEFDLTWDSGKKQLANLLRLVLKDPQVQNERPFATEAADSEQMEEVKDTINAIVNEFRQTIIEDIDRLEAERHPQLKRSDLKPLETPDDFRIPYNSNPRVFVVQGSNIAVNDAICQYLQERNFQLVISAQNFHSGGSIVRHFEEDSAIDFAVVILSADYNVYLKEQSPADAWLMSNQAVVFQLGYLVSKLGKKRVLTVHEELLNFKCPTNYFEVFYSSFDNRGAWREDFSKRLTACGLIKNQAAAKPVR